MNLLSEYNAIIASSKIKNDPLQREILNHFQRLLEELRLPRRSWFNWRKEPYVKGVYLYGTVGAGKTFLMDLFYQHLHGQGKARFHFHHFMQQVDGLLRRLQGQKNPLHAIAVHFAQTIRVLCLDEMLVNDVAHAMILAELFQYLFKEGIILVTTSNTAPDDLYRNGVQRVRFLPAIAAIHEFCEIIVLNNMQDFRLNRQPSYQAYLYPLNPQTLAQLDKQLQNIDVSTAENSSITIQNRLISFIKLGEKSIWFDFNVLCNLPRSQLDYLELVKRFDLIVISNIPQITSLDSANAILLVNLIDVLYDNHTKIMLSAAVPLEQLFVTGLQTFQRTFSRLQEMQSIDYCE